MNKKTLHIITLYGVGGDKYSTGLDKLTQRIEKEVSGITVTVYKSFQWNSHVEVEQLINSLPKKDMIMLIGHSGGANETTIIANDIPSRQIDMIVAYHLSTWMGNRKPLGSNVSRVIEIYGSNFFNIWGKPLIKTTEEFKGTRWNIYSKDSHTSVDDDTGLHQVVVEETLKMLG